MAVPEKVDDDKFKEEEYRKYDPNNIKDAILDDKELPCCPDCKEPLGWIADYKMVMVDNIKYNYFIRKCNKCGNACQYCLDTSLEKRYTFDSNIIKNVTCTISREDD